MSQPPLWLLLPISFAISVSGFIVDQAFRWSNPTDGALNGLFHVILNGILWLIFVLPLNVLAYGVYRWLGWRRFRALAILAPAMVIFAFEIAGLFSNPPTAPNRLRRLAGVELPPTARELRTHFTGGGVADYGDTYYFRCSREDSEHLIQALGLGPTDKYDQHYFSRAPFPSWPDPSMWEGSTLYRGERSEGAWFYYLRTDASREQVYLLIACI